MKFLFLCLVVALSGCASTAEIQREMYSQRIAEQSKVDQQKAAVEAARYNFAGKLTDPTAQLAFAISDGIASALRASGAGQQQLPPMPLIEGWDDKLLKFAGILAPVAVNALGIVSNARVATKQAEYGRDIALGDQRARVDTVTAVANGMGGVARDGFAANIALGSKPTSVVNINGNGNAVDGSAVDNSNRPTTNTNNCASGNGGNGGNSAPAGNGGNPTGAGAAGAGGANTAGAGAPSGSVPCSIQK